MLGISCANLPTKYHQSARKGGIAAGSPAREGLLPAQGNLRRMIWFVTVATTPASKTKEWILIEQDEREPYRVRLARAYISNHQSEYFSLSDLARSVHVSTFYLCKIFKKAMRPGSSEL